MTIVPGFFYVHLCNSGIPVADYICNSKNENIIFAKTDSSFLGPFETEDEAINAWMLLGRSTLSRYDEESRQWELCENLS